MGGVSFFNFELVKTEHLWTPEWDFLVVYFSHQIDLLKVE